MSVVILLGIQEVVDIGIAIPFCLVLSLLLLAFLNPLPHNVRAEGCGLGGSGTDVIHWRKEVSCQGGEDFIKLCSYQAVHFGSV